MTLYNVEWSQFHPLNVCFSLSWLPFIALISKNNNNSISFFLIYYGSDIVFLNLQDVC